MPLVRKWLNNLESVLERFLLPRDEEWLHRLDSSRTVMIRSRGYVHCQDRVGVVAGALLDEYHPPVPAVDPRDTNTYLFGRMGSHNVVIACLPAKKTGKVLAAIVAKDLLRSFKAIRFGLMVGVGGGAPYYNAKRSNSVMDVDCEVEDSEQDGPENTQDIHLGDVVIRLHSKTSEAVVQYDFGKSKQGKEYIRTGTINKTSSIVLSAVGMLQGQYVRNGHKLSEQISKMVLDDPRMAKKFKYPGLEKDQLFETEFAHVNDKKQCKDCCGSFDINLVKRKNRNSTDIVLHYGTIGSVDRVVQDATLRNKWAQKEKIKCFEMEAAGLMDDFPCLIIRGVSTYADSHKNKVW